MKRLFFTALAVLALSCQKETLTETSFEKGAAVSLDLKHATLSNGLKVVFNCDTVYIDADTIAAPIEDPLLFAGSSSSTAAMWPTLEQDFADFAPVVRKAYGGKTWGHLDLFTDTAFAPLHPRQIVGWTGENDIYDPYSRGVKFTEGDYTYRWTNAIKHWRKSMPNTHITVIATKKTPKLKAFWDFIDHTNAYEKAYLAKMPNTSFIEVNDLLTPSDYRSDGMHLIYAAYPKLVERIKPFIIK